MGSILPKKAKVVIFTERPIPVPYNYRISYKITQIALIIKFCSGTKACSIEKIHIISNSLSTKKELGKLKNYLNEIKGEVILARFDPSINRAIDFALAENLILRQKNGLFKLTKKGSIYINEIINDKDIFLFEKVNLEDIGLKLTEEKVEQLISFWSDFNV
jgi:hypothetical protein